MAKLLTTRFNFENYHLLFANGDVIWNSNCWDWSGLRKFSSVKKKSNSPSYIDRASLPHIWHTNRTYKSTRLETVSIQFSQIFSYPLFYLTRYNTKSPFSRTRKIDARNENGIIRKISNVHSSFRLASFKTSLTKAPPSIEDQHPPLLMSFSIRHRRGEGRKKKRKKNADDTYRIYASSTHTLPYHESFIPRVFTTHPFASRQKTINTA